LPGYEKYEKAQAGRAAPIQICNHSTIFDECYLLTNGLTPGFLAKDEIKKLPFVGKIAECMQGIFVKRGSEESKQWTLDQIALRIKNILAGKKFPPMAIYPEGTTNNGTDLMHFKRGAFMNEAPLKIYGFQISSPDVNPTWNLLTMAEVLFLQMSRYDYALTLHEFDNFDPMYTINTHGLTPGDSEINLE
jgi:1-acyl-sn-glycerol-3-phosphate acyltransferase